MNKRYEYKPRVNNSYKRPEYTDAEKIEYHRRMIMELEAEIEYRSNRIAALEDNLDRKAAQARKTRR